MIDIGAIWAKASATMDAVVDQTLGDSLSYAVAGQPARAIAGFVLDVDSATGIEGFDENIGQRKRVKVAKSAVAMPQRADRIQHQRLGPGVYQPIGSEPITQGRYWIFDVQRVA